MEKTLSPSNSNPLYEKYIYKSYVYRAFACLHLLLLLSFLTYRLLCYLHECCGVIWIVAFSCELWFSLQFVLYHNLVWLSVEYKAYPERLARRYGGESASKLPPVDIIITTTDPYKEPALITANTVLSVLALDYPVEKIACYVTDDGGSPITFYSLVETLEFAKKWVPFCRNFNIELRIPIMYFSKTPKSSDPKFLQQWQVMKDEYESMKRRIADALERGHVILESVSEDDVNDFVYKSSDVKNHSSIVKVIHENKISQGNEDFVLPHIIYVAREKRPMFNHHYKAGAMNVMARVSGLMTNAPFILNLDCDMHVCNPKVIQHAMCFYLDCPSERDSGFVQFPQLFYGTLEDDPFGNQLKSVFNIIFKGMNGIQGPLYGGTCCFHRRKGLYGVPPRTSVADQHYSKDKCPGIKGKEFQDEAIRSAFGASSALVSSAETVMRDNGFHNKSYPSLAIEEALKVASCGYEANTGWGTEVGWMYGSSVEDVMTGLKIHRLGWNSIYYSSEKPAFMGCAPGNGPDTLVQYKRWATGMLEILISRLCPFLGMNSQLTLRQRMLYAYCTLSTITSMVVLVYVLLPAFSLLSGKAFLPKIEDPTFMVAAGLFLSMYGNDLFEYLMCGCSVREWWNNQRMALISRLSSHLFALFDIVMMLVGLSEIGFVVTPKGGENDEVNEGEFTFNSSPLFIPPTTIVLINLAALIKSTFQIVVGRCEVKDKLFAEYFCSAWVVINLWPFLKGLVRKGKCGLPWSVVIKASCLAVFLARTWLR
ncbi:cellulose synthase-like protein H1 isoform X1 [Cryptomeria japonica]|uniref:cellulose synthase-like protein H1 isoform X1 n=1 Tax=Cryptomeria japonica TaxID=3369 RepID=UPI0027DA75FC|nr:cellulose synthase-like protein H1 isoform X1 [Cryptomeria japonica]